MYMRRIKLQHHMVSNENGARVCYNAISTDNKRPNIAFMAHYNARAYIMVSLYYTSRRDGRKASRTCTNSIAQI